ncbi:MAG: MBL fold metallo-hydrolase [Bacteroidetes bacterium]|nr:MAG: MBL fold metallo-hydrolase [Bacteroidota bacterium]
MNTKLLLLISLLLAAYSARAQRDFSQVEIKVVPVKGNIYMLQGAGGNIGLYAGETTAMLIDNQFAPLAEKIQAAAKSVKDVPIRVLINTHLHGDHTGGNQPFAEGGSLILAQENVRSRMSKEQVNEFFNRTTPPSPAIALPVITFGDDMHFNFFEEEIAVYHYAAAHTDGDAVIYFKSSNVIHTGDVFVTYGFPFVDAYNGGSINGFIHFLDKILGLINDETIVIPGHGDLSTKADVRRFRDRLTTIRDRVYAGYQAGKSVDDILKEKPTAEFDEEWGKGFIKGEDFVKLIYLSFDNPEK